MGHFVAPKPCDEHKSANNVTNEPSYSAKEGPSRTTASADSQRHRRLLVQAKLSVGPADDRYEREADATADRVVRALDSGRSSDARESSVRVQRMAVGTSRSLVTKKAVSRVQRAAKIGLAGGEIDGDTERQITSARGGGKAIKASVRAPMESAFGADFGGVRIHEGSTSTELNERIQAKAFTVGNDIFFRGNAPDATSASGQHLLAHELTHTIQQGAAPMNRLQPSTVASPESDSDSRVQRSMVVKAPVKRAGAATIQRLGDATQLRGLDAHYGNERVVQRPGLVGVVQDYGTVVSLLYAAIQALNLAGDPPSVAAAVAPLNAPPLDGFYSAIATLTKPQMLARCTKVYSTQLEKARLQDINISDDGVVHAGALATRLVVYDESMIAQTKTRVSVTGGKLKRSPSHALAGADVDTTASVTQHSGKGWEIFVVGASGNIHVASHKIGKFHHSSLLAGAPVSMAGEMKVAGGKIVTMSNKSGHYTPGPEHFHHFVKELEKQGIPLNFNVAGWGIGTGTAAAWLATLPANASPERMDNMTVWESLRAEGKNPYPFLLAPPPVGMGWRQKPAETPAAAWEKPDPAGGGGWVDVPHDEARVAVERKFGKAKAKVERTGGPIQWL
jgi:hypothetical protein